MSWPDLGIVLIRVVGAFVLLLVLTVLNVWVERKVLADMQNRLGPMRAGPFGVLQTVADGLKLFFKESIMPKKAEVGMYLLAPFLAVVPAFFGLGVMWAEDAPWAGSVAALLDPWDRNPALERLERERVGRLVDRYRMDRQSELLRSMLGSRAFALAESVSRWRQRGDPVFSRERIRQTLGE